MAARRARGYFDGSNLRAGEPYSWLGDVWQAAYVVAFEDFRRCPVLVHAIQECPHVGTVIRPKPPSFRPLIRGAYLKWGGECMKTLLLNKDEVGRLISMAEVIHGGEIGHKLRHVILD